MEDLLQRAQELFGGGALSPLLIVAGLVALYLAWKAVRFTLRIVALGVAAVLLLGVVPWSGEAVAGPVADCAASTVQRALPGWEAMATKRITVEELSADATCTAAGDGLAAGSATARSRTFFDVPFRTWEVAPGGAAGR